MILIHPFRHLRLWIDRNRPKGDMIFNDHSSRDVILPSLTMHSAQQSHHFATPLSTHPTSLNPNTTWINSPLANFRSDKEVIEENNRTQFKSLEEGSQALTAFFFDSSQNRELENNAEKLSLVQLPLGTTPNPIAIAQPHAAYRKHQSLVQPCAKSTTRQQNNLLALLNVTNPTQSLPEEADCMFNKVRDTGHASNVVDTKDDSVSTRRRENISYESTSKVLSSAPTNKIRPLESDKISKKYYKQDTLERQEKRETLLQALFAVSQNIPKP